MCLLRSAAPTCHNVSMQLHAQKQICVTPTHTHLQQQHWTEQIRYLDLCAPARRQASAFVSAVPRFLAVSLICRITSGLCSSKVQDAVHLGHVHLGGQAPTLQPRSNLIDRDGLERSTAWWHCIRQSANPWTVTVCSNLHSRSKPCTEVTSRQECVICPSVPARTTQELQRWQARRRSAAWSEPR